jgi:ribonucleoside-diphosphate reductase alpha chain
MDYFKQPISEYIWDMKYRYRLHDNIMDQTIEDTWLRVAKAASQAEAKTKRETWQKQFYSILENFQFIPGGRILAGAGTQHDVTLFNCFVMPILDDSLPSIFDALKEGALTLQQGGGVGYDFSVLRPKGWPAITTGSVASGPVSFMRIWNVMCGTMLSTGARRGAMMGVLRCDHPDIEEFITAKRDPNELRHFNVSVVVSDAFMQAVENNSEWALVFQKNVVRNINARKLWEKIIKSAYDYAEPGVLFEDTINRKNNLWYREWISATNPCGEIPLPHYGACNLGSMNLTKFILNPFNDKARIDWEKLKKSTAIATRFLDNIIDVSKYPLSMQQKEAHDTRRIGLGFTGLADALLMLGKQYGSQESLQLASEIMRCIAETTWKVSIELAKERGAFPLFQKEKYMDGEFVKRLPSLIQMDIEKHGIRHSHHNTIAPTGTISLLANNVSHGIEPIFSAKYQRSVRTVDDKLQCFTIKDFAMHQWEQSKHHSSFPPSWVDSQMLTPMDHLQMQAAVQPYIDNAISKTINIPENYPFEKLQEVYTKAFEFGLKGCTIYRPNAITGSVLSIADEDDQEDRCCQ